MKVLIVPSWYPQGEDKLMGIYHKEYASALAKRGIDVDMLFVSRERLKHPFKYLFMKKFEIEEADGYKVYKIRMLNVEALNVKLFMCIYKKRLEKLYKKYLKFSSSPDILHAQVTLPAGYATCKLGEKYDIPVLITEHSSNLRKYFEGAYAPYGKYALSNARYSTVSKLMKDQIEDLKSDVDVIPNLIDTKFFHRDRYKRGSTLKIALVSAFRIGKGIEYAIEAISILVSKGFKDVHLNIVGDGYNMDYYKSVSDKFKMNDYITFLGRKTKSDIADLLSKSDIFLVSSDYESFCIPGVEALASGLPVVSTRCHGPEEYLDNKCGEFCDIKDPEGMASAIEKVYNKLDKYDIKYLRHVADKYSDEAVCKKAVKIYEDMKKSA